VENKERLMAELNDLHRMVGELAGTVKSLTTSVEGLRTDVKAGTEKMHDRISEQGKRVGAVETALAEAKGDTAARKAIRGGLLTLGGGSLGAILARLFDKWGAGG
jgi:phage-related tail protein